MQGYYAVICLGCLLSISTAVSADIEMAEGTDLYGDIRSGYYTKTRDDRDNAKDTTDEFRLRIRIGALTEFNQHYSFAARVAGRYSTVEGNHGFRVDFPVPSTDGLEFGDSSLDEFYAQYKSSASWSVKAGRMQSKFELDGVAKKSLDRNNSPNSDITWTDGVYVMNKTRGWGQHVILQYNDEDGPSHVYRSPLDFSDDGSRWSLFAAIENKDKVGPFIQRGLDINYLPDSLYAEGTAINNLDDYIAIVARTAAKWPLTVQSQKKPLSFLLGLELGYAPNTPKAATVKTGVKGDAGGFAGQLSLNLIDFIPGQGVALVLAHADAGWLISPDFRPNTDLYELRYQWKINRKNRLEGRIRLRQDADSIIGAAEDREDTDFYLRYTYKL